MYVYAHIFSARKSNYFKNPQTHQIVRRLLPESVTNLHMLACINANLNFSDPSLITPIQDFLFPYITHHSDY